MAKVVNDTDLDTYVLEVLRLAGMGEISAKNKEVYVPQLRAEIEIRLGAALMPELTPENAVTFAKMVEEEQMEQDVWQAFWRNVTPEYDQIVENVLLNFARECKALLASA